MQLGSGEAVVCSQASRVANLGPDNRWNQLKWEAARRIVLKAPSRLLGCPPSPLWAYARGEGRGRPRITRPREISLYGTTGGAGVLWPAAGGQRKEEVLLVMNLTIVQGECARDA